MITQVWSPYRWFENSERACVFRWANGGTGEGGLDFEDHSGFEEA